MLNDRAAGTAAPAAKSGGFTPVRWLPRWWGWSRELTIGKKKYAEAQSRDAITIAENADHLRSLLHAAVVEDANAYTEVMKAMKRSKAKSAMRLRGGDAARGRSFRCAWRAMRW